MTTATARCASQTRRCDSNRRRSSRGPPGAAAPERAAARRPARHAAVAARRAGGGPPGAGPSGGRHAGGETPDRRTLWLLRGPNPTPVRVRAGVSDGTNTEIETAELHEGDRVVTAAEMPGGDSKTGPAGS